MSTVTPHASTSTCLDVCTGLDEGREIRMRRGRGRERERDLRERERRTDAEKPSHACLPSRSLRSSFLHILPAHPSCLCILSLSLSLSFSLSLFLSLSLFALAISALLAPTIFLCHICLACSSFFRSSFLHISLFFASSHVSHSLHGTRRGWEPPGCTTPGCGAGQHQVAESRQNAERRHVQELRSIMIQRLCMHS